MPLCGICCHTGRASCKQTMRKDEKKHTCAWVLRVNRFVRLKIERNLLFLALVCQDRTDEQDQTVWRHSRVEFETLLGGSDCGEDGLSVDARLDVGRCTVFLR